MPTSCGGLNPESWKPGDSEGMWAVPVILGAVNWMFQRLIANVFQLFAPEIEPEAGGGHVILVIKTGLKWCAAAFMTPMLSMTVAEDCPQVVTSFYSGPTQTWLASMTIGLPFFQCFCWRLGEIGKSRLEGALSSESNKGADATQSNESGSMNCLWCVGWMSAACTPIALAITTIVYYGFLAANMGWDLAFGISFNFSLNWPEFKFAYHIQVVRILFFVLWLVDIVEVAVGLTAAIVNKVAE